jgi:hypothetical protein
VSWTVALHAEFVSELAAMERQARVAILSSAEVLAEFGPRLGRPYFDTLKGSKFRHMKELRVTLPDGEIRVAFAFDPARSAILLVGGSKSGKSQSLFYKTLIATADRPYREHLTDLKGAEESTNRARDP